MRKLTALVLTGVLLLALCACGGGTATGGTASYTGTWIAARAGMGESLQFDADEIFEGEFSIQIKKSGVCTVTYGGESGEATWTATDDGAITIRDSETEMSGTIDETTLFLNLDNGVNVTFHKEGAVIADTTETAEEDAEGSEAAE